MTGSSPNGFTNIMPMRPQNSLVTFKAHLIQKKRTFLLKEQSQFQHVDLSAIMSASIKHHITIHTASPPLHQPTMPRIIDQITKPRSPNMNSVTQSVTVELLAKLLMVEMMMPGLANNLNTIWEQQELLPGGGGIVLLIADTLHLWDQLSTVMEDVRGELGFLAWTTVFWIYIKSLVKLEDWFVVFIYFFCSTATFTMLNFFPFLIQ
ncbi:hypothetical protein L873DRAFT_1786252 [Choiromyces venosus 120613-1]|uniref:Uncharacterized protein n=1 Tax=Choiromyces venosus 120613-1 TaxID=1336337 RepID=A0A3N4K5F3_9PEZI|nr:hypothetical protein L873DRAFT_1786252 [Choiromyces venosus 120613-1]